MVSGGRNITMMEGQRFGALTVIRRAPRTHRQADWICRCDCGRECIKRGYKLRQGSVKTCGVNNCSWWRFAKRGNARRPEYSCWKHMLRRCSQSKYKYYRGRGIAVCERWKTFANFLADMGPRPSLKHTLDRINNDGNYEPGNVRWATTAEQNLNRRNTLWVEHEGERVRLFDLLERLGIKKSVVYARLSIGWPLEKALTEPVRSKKKQRKKKRLPPVAKQTTKPFA